MKLYKVTLLVFLVFCSCASRQDLVYFQGMDNVKYNSEINYSPRLKADDQLSIVISSLDNSVTLPYNGISDVNEGLKISYLIDRNGDVELPQLGKIHIAGLTTTQASKMIKGKLKEFVDNPRVNVLILNFKISVLGEVNAPGVYPVLTERISILDAIGKAGDLTIYGERKNILVIREGEERIMHYRIDLTSESLFNSPAFYLQQNDQVYIEPNKSKINSSKSSATTGIIFSATSLLVTVLTLILR